MLLDYSVQDRVDGSAWGVGSHGARPSGFRAVAATRPQDARTTSTPRSSRRQDETPGATERCGGPSPYGGGENSARTSVHEGGPSSSTGVGSAAVRHSVSRRCPEPAVNERAACVCAEGKTSGV